MMVGLLWLAITVVGVVVAPSVSGHLKNGVHVDTAAYAANQQIARQYGGVTSDPGVLVINVPHGQTAASAGVRAELAAFDARVAKASPGQREVSYASTGSPVLLGTGGKSTIVLVYPPRAGTDLPASVLSQLAATARTAMPGAAVHSTGLSALSTGGAAAAHSSVLSELALGALATTIVLAWVFGSFLALLPLIMALVSVLAMLGALLAVVALRQPRPVLLLTGSAADLAKLTEEPGRPRSERITIIGV
jgi:RND superfamily putative drug exporter